MSLCPLSLFSYTMALLLRETKYISGLSLGFVVL